MKFAPTNSVGDISGVNAGGVGMKGNMGRFYTVPRNPQSSAQQQVRNTFAANSQGWAGLTDAQRTAWNAFAKNYSYSDVFGNQFKLSGKGMYQKLNMNIVLAGGTAISDPPTTTAVTPQTTAAFASNTSAAQTISFAPSPVPTGQTLVIMATAPLSKGYTAPGKSLYKRVGTAAAAATSPKNSFAGYSAIFGTPVTGKKIFGLVFMVSLTSGFVSVATKFSSTTA